MSDLHERTARIIAEAEVLLEKARGDVQRSREALGEYGESENIRQCVAQQSDPEGLQLFDHLVAECESDLRMRASAERGVSASPKQRRASLRKFI